MPQQQDPLPIGTKTVDSACRGSYKDKCALKAGKVATLKLKKHAYETLYENNRNGGPRPIFIEVVNKDAATIRNQLVLS